MYHDPAVVALSGRKMEMPELSRLSPERARVMASIASWTPAAARRSASETSSLLATGSTKLPRSRRKAMS